MTDNLDKLIEEYSQRLMTSIPEEQLRQSSISPEKESETETAEQEEPSDTNQAEEAAKERDGQEPSATEGMSQENEVPQSLKEAEPIPTEPLNFSSFMARVFTADSAFAIENARVSIYEGETLYAFLTTNKNGETIKIKLEAFPEENSLEPLSEDQRINYSADVAADGFTTQKGLLVSAVGGADIVLNVQLIPESEGIN